MPRNADVPVMVNGEPNPTGTGRYCLPPPGTCYCGKCAWWRPPRVTDWSQQPGTDAYRKRLAELDPP